MTTKTKQKVETDADTIMRALDDKIDFESCRACANPRFNLCSDLMTHNHTFDLTLCGGELYNSSQYATLNSHSAYKGIDSNITFKKENY